MRASQLLASAAWLAVGTDAFAHFANVLRDADGGASELKAQLSALADNPDAAERLLADRARSQSEKRDADPQLLGLPTLNLPGGLLGGGPLGGGLLGGLLQPLTGVLRNIQIPLPQPTGLKEIPGDDPNHQFQKPGPTDVRGMCPTLNALANHGYISRNGITSFAEVANACQIGFGLGYDVSTLLSAVGLLAGGDLLSGKYSIGGQDDRVPNTLGLAPGLDSHGGFEIDTSITRQDVHWGNNANFINDKWLDYAALAEEHGGEFGYDMNVIDAGRAYDRSRKFNPSFLAGVLWLFVTHVERVFVFALLPNGTAPDAGFGTGPADYQNVAPFFLDERFPENWYRRATPWTAQKNFGTAFRMYFDDPKELGANVGVDNFVPLGLNLTNKTPRDITCLVVMNLLDVIPSQLAQPALLSHRNLFSAFMKGAVWPLFMRDGHFNCAVDEFSGPSQSAGENFGSFSASGSPVNGSYDGLGFIQADGPS